MKHGSKLIVNYDRSIEDSLIAGKYDNKHDNITGKNFPSSKKGKKKVDFRMFYFNKGMLSENVISKMKKVGYHPATMNELLAFGEKNPKLQRKFSIAALGSVAEINGLLCVGFLDGSDSKRDVDMYAFDLEWFSSCRFLAVRN